MKKSLLCLTLPLVLTTMGCSQQTSKTNFTYWNDCSALTTLKTFVEGATKKGADTFIPTEDRVAVFDMDGTVFGELYPTYFEYIMFVYRALEDPDYAPNAPEDVKAVAEEIRLGMPTHTYASDMAIRHGKAAAKAYANMTIPEFADYVVTFSKKAVNGFNNLTYANAVYKPMINVVDYLHENDFNVYLVSGSDRFICRELVRDPLRIPDDHVIGMDVKLYATHQGDTDGVDYQFTKDDELKRSDEMTIKNLKFNKVAAIMKEVGKQPVLSFGNTSGDQAMHTYTITNNKYKEAKAFMLVADDGDRDNGGSKNDGLHQKWAGMGFHTISMKNDFKTIYGENVTKISSNN